MKKPVALRASIVISLLILVDVFNLIQAKRDNPRLNEESQKFVDQAIPSLTRTWNPIESKDLFVKAVRDSINNENMKATFSSLNALLGPILVYNGSKGEAGIHLSVWGTKWTSAEYTGSGNFKNGYGVVRVELRVENGFWKVASFNAYLKPEH